MKQRILLIGLAVVLVVGSVGCGGGDDNINGRWERNPGRLCCPAYEFSGNRFTRFLRDDWVGGSGTFSISGDYIEFVYEDGRIEVRSFSRTENTILIGQTRYTRASGSAAPAPAAATPAPPAEPAPAAPTPAPAAPTQAAPTPTVGYGDLDGRWERYEERRLLTNPESYDIYTRWQYAIEFSGDSFIAYANHFIWSVSPDQPDSEPEWRETDRGTFLIRGYEPDVRFVVVRIDENTIIFNDNLYNRVS